MRVPGIPYFACVWAGILTLALCSVPVWADHPLPWKVGVAKVNITPENPMWMAGYASRDRPAQGKLTDLWAKENRTSV